MELIAHIGLPKAGSTTLQRHLFPKLAGIKFIGMIPANNVGQDVSPAQNVNSDLTKSLLDLLVRDENFNAQQAKTVLSKILEQHPGEERILFSSEFLTSVFFCYPNIQEKIMRLKLLGFSKVMIVGRNQSDLLKSQYRDHPFEPHDLIHGKPIDVDDWAKQSDKLSFSFLDAIQLNDLTELCEEYFGAKNVKLLLFEDMVNKEGQFLESINAFLQTSFDVDHKPLLPKDNEGVNKRYNDLRRLKKRLLGKVPIKKFFPKKLTESLLKKIKTGTKEEVLLSPETQNLISAKFGKSNAALATRLNISLKEYQYPLE